MNTQFPSVEEALYLHERLLSRYGGTGGVRDLGLLESALARPRSGYYAALTEQAAALLQSLACNHAFVDGNKRMAFALSVVFLRTNGYGLSVSADDAEAFLIGRVIQAKADIREIADWLGTHLSANP
jgi:death-on-curing protein